MARAGPRKVQRYSLEFKLTAVRMSPRAERAAPGDPETGDRPPAAPRGRPRPAAGGTRPPETKAIRFCSTRRGTSSPSSTRSGGPTGSPGSAGSTGSPGGVLRVAAPAAEPVGGAEPTRDDPVDRALPGPPGALREPPPPPAAPGGGLAGEPAAGSAADAPRRAPGARSAGVPRQSSAPPLLHSASEPPGPAPAAAGQPKSGWATSPTSRWAGNGGSWRW